MNKQPIDNHPVDQFMQTLDANVRPLMNEAHWEGMQALLDQNFPADDSTSGGAAHSDSKPETGAGKMFKRFRWIFLGGFALIMTMAGTQWSALAIQNSQENQVREIQEKHSGQIETSTDEQVGSAIKKIENPSKQNANVSENSGTENLDSKESSLNESATGGLQGEIKGEQEMQNPSLEKLNQGNGMVTDSIPARKQNETATDSSTIKKKKFIFW